MQLDKVSSLTEEELATIRPNAARISQTKDPWKRLGDADQGMTFLKAGVEQMAAVRGAAIFELHDELGHSDREISEFLGTSSARIRQILKKERETRGLPGRRTVKSRPPVAAQTQQNLRALREKDPEAYEKIVQEVEAAVNG